MLDKNLLLGRMVSAGENQETLSRKLGVSRSTFSRCVNGKSCFDLDQARKLCELLEIGTDAERSKIFFATPS